jgi:hypothetical protein
MANGRYCDLTFYHATSEVAARSILELGARNVLRDLGAQELGRRIWDAFAKHGGVENLYSIAKNEAEHLSLTALEPSDPSAKGLFSYGAFFVTLNLGNAYRYALNNPFRSEFLRALHGGVSLLRRLNDPMAMEAPKLFPAVHNLLQARYLREDGGEAAAVEIELFLQMGELPGVNMPASFRAYEVSPADVLAVHDLADWVAFEVPDPPWQPNPSMVAAARFQPDVWAASRTEARQL